MPRGTTTVISDPHEIANVLGLEGIRFMLECAKGSPLSTVRHGALLRARDRACRPRAPRSTRSTSPSFRTSPWVLGLAEVMNFPGVVGGDPEVLAKLAAFAGPRRSTATRPGSSGKALAAYAASGIASDHESTTDRRGEGEAAARA